MIKFIVRHTVLISHVRFMFAFSQLFLPYILTIVFLFTKVLYPELNHTYSVVSLTYCQ